MLKILRSKAVALYNNDKFKHFSVCYFSGLFGTHGAAFGMGLGIGKEYGDSKAIGNKWDWLDIAADFAGAISGLFTHYAIKLIF